MEVKQKLIPPIKPPSITSINDEDEPCMYCGSLLEPYCNDIHKCDKSRAAKETRKLLDEMRATQNYRLNT